MEVVHFVVKRLACATSVLSPVGPLAARTRASATVCRSWLATFVRVPCTWIPREGWTFGNVEPGQLVVAARLLESAFECNSTRTLSESMKHRP